MNFQYLTSLLLLLTVCFYACSEKQNNNPQIIDSQALLATFNKGKLPNNSAYGSYSKGKAFLRTTAENGIAIYVEASENGQSSTTFYLLQKEQLQEDHFELTLGEVEVLYFHKAVLINALNSQVTYLFQIDEQTLPSAIWELSFTRIFNGYGLSINKNYTLQNGSVVSEESTFRSTGYGSAGDPAEVSCSCWTNGAVSHTDCDAGGPGSSDCSVTSSTGQTCSANCKEGYESCCNF